MANALVESLFFVPPHRREEILWRTGTSKEAMNADTAWKRRKLLNKDIESIKDAVTSRGAGLGHHEAIDSYLQLQFVSGCSNWRLEHYSFTKLMEPYDQLTRVLFATLPTHRILPRLPAPLSNHGLTLTTMSLCAIACTTVVLTLIRPFHHPIHPNLFLLPRRNHQRPAEHP